MSQTQSLTEKNQVNYDSHLDFDCGPADIIQEEDQDKQMTQLLGLGGLHKRTKTLIETKQLKEVKQAFKEDGQEVTDDFLVDVKPRKICCLPVKEGVNCWNVLAIPLTPCIIMLLTTYVNAQTIFLLRDDSFFTIDETKLGRISTTLVLVGFPGAMIGTFVAGYLYDIIGRRITLFISFFIGSIMVFTIPYTAPSVFPALLSVRICITLCFAAPAANPLIPDYIHKDSIGKAAVLVGIGFIVGEVISMGLLFNVTKPMTAYNAFLTAAALGAVCSCLFLFLVKEPQLRELAKELTGNKPVPTSKTSNLKDVSQSFEGKEKQSDLLLLPSEEQNTESAQQQVNNSEPANKISEEEFNKLSCCKKLGHINRQLVAACKRNKMFIVLFFACLVSRLYYVMFSTFWVLYLTSQVGIYLENDEEVSTLYANLMLCSVSIGIALSPFIGIFTDTVSPRVTLPVAFFFRAFSIGLFYFIEDPTQPYAYVVGTMLVFGTTCEQICTDCVTLRNADKEIRGVIMGTAVAFGYAGQLMLCVLGGWLFDNVGPKSPFILVGGLDLIFAVMSLILGCTGVIFNDIRLREQQAQEISQKRTQIEHQLDLDRDKQCDGPSEADPSHPVTTGSYSINQ